MHFLSLMKRAILTWTLRQTHSASYFAFSNFWFSFRLAFPNSPQTGTLFRHSWDMNIGAKYAVKPQVSQIIAFTGPRQHNIANIFYYFKEAIKLGSPPLWALHHIAQNFNFVMILAKRFSLTVETPHHIYTAFHF